MQTFVPFADHRQSAKVLDSRRLNKQCIENLQILGALLDPNYGWQHHPAVTMWRDHEKALLLYHRIMCLEAVSRGISNTTWVKAAALADPILLEFNDPEPYLLCYPPPKWLGDERVHKTHRSNLLRKDPKHYGQFGWSEPSNLAYFWPSSK